MSLTYSSGPHYLTIDLTRVRDSVCNDEARVRERAVIFHESEVRLLDELKKSLTEGRESECLTVLSKMEELSAGMYVEPITTLCRRGKHLMSSKNPNNLMTELVAQLETALQGTVNLLRSEGLLRDDVEINPPL